MSFCCFWSDRRRRDHFPLYHKYIGITFVVYTAPQVRLVVFTAAARYERGGGTKTVFEASCVSIEIGRWNAEIF